MEQKQETIRLNKYLAECGVCSRRDGDKLIAAGKVTIDGRVACMGERVSGTELIAVQGKVLRGRNPRLFSPIISRKELPARSVISMLRGL